MNGATQLEHRASSRLRKHEGEPSFGLCDRLDRTRDNSQRQLPTDHDYAVPTREYQTDQSSLKPAQAAARSVLGERQRQLQKQPHRSSRIDTVTPYQAKCLAQARHFMPMCLAAARHFTRFVRTLLALQTARSVSFIHPPQPRSCAKIACVEANEKRK
jgi:hypothetical protein